MNPVQIQGIAKTFGDVQAVKDVSFEVGQGEIFGLLGPNGAGKTTSIRILLDIFRPDTGSVSILGGPLTDAKKSRIGYLPEERGLYQDVPLGECLLFFAELKGMKRADALVGLKTYLERFDLDADQKKKVKELSKGMQQKAQIISAILHRPEVLIIDEPFSGLDPVNTELVRTIMAELRTDGTTILMSTHQMHQVEELCDRLVLIDNGTNVLYGKLSDIRRKNATGEVVIRVLGEIPAIPGVAGISPENGGEYRLHLEPGVSPDKILHRLVEAQVAVEKFEIAMPNLHEIFIKTVSIAPSRGSKNELTK